jgi:hypothetical protein
MSYLIPLRENHFFAVEKNVVGVDKFTVRSGRVYSGHLPDRPKIAYVGAGENLDLS